MIRPPTINLARRPFRNNNLYYAVFGACFVVLLAASGYNVWQFASTGSDLDRLEETLAERTARYNALREEIDHMKSEVTGLDLATLTTKSNFANGLILSKLFSWSLLFDRIEALIPPDIKIRSIRPSISSQGIDISIDGMAKTAEVLYEFEAALDASEYFAGVYPVSESTRESKTEINFDLGMSYIPAGESSEPLRSPATPTEGLPQPEPAAPVEGVAGAETASAAPGQTGAAATSEGADGALAAEVGAPAPGGPAVPAGASSAPKGTPAPAPAAPPAPAPASAGTKPSGGPEPAFSGAADNPWALAPTGPAAQTNAEMLKKIGQEKFLAARGKLYPAAAGEGADLSNEAYIRKHGMPAFLRTRGALNRKQQAITPPGAAAGEEVAP